MIIKMTEWACLTLIAVIFVRAALTITNSKDKAFWDSTEHAGIRACRFFSGYRKKSVDIRGYMMYNIIR